MSLRKQIKCGDGIDRISAGNELLQIARERRRVAGNVRDRSRTQIDNSFNHCRLSACTRRIQQYKIHRANRIITKPVRNRRRDHACIRQSRPLQVSACEASGSRIRFHSYDFLKPSRQRKCKQPNSTIKIQNTLTRRISQRKIDQRPKQRRIDLKERLRIVTGKPRLAPSNSTRSYETRQTPERTKLHSLPEPRRDVSTLPEPGPTQSLELLRASPATAGRKTAQSTTSQTRLDPRS